jgi:D-alanyl-D-alanine carboxypeptidase
MKTIQILAKSLILVFFISFPSNVFAKIAALVIDYDSGEVLFEVNADTRNHPASLTKMMTLYIAFDYLNKDKLEWKTLMKVSEVANSRSPSKLYLEVGSLISVEDAIMALVIKSANDVATVISEHISGTEREFAKLMTKYARNLGMGNTTFKNASGLHHSDQLTTARDMATLSRAMISNFPVKYKLFQKEKFVWKGKTYKTHNRLMQSYEGADGIKTGYIQKSGFQLAFSAVRQNKRLIGIYFGGNTGRQRDDKLRFYMDEAFNELKITKNKKTNTNQIIKLKKPNLLKYKIVVGTFKYKNNAEKHIKIIKQKYPKTTNAKEDQIVLIKSNGKQLYESRFQFFSKKNAQLACARLKKYDRDCFIRG